MEVYKTDEERVEAIKAWWEKNGKFVIIIAIVSISAFSGVRVWNNFKAAEASRVAAQYNQLLDELQEEKSDAALQRGSTIVEQNASSSYASFAALAMAKIEVEKGDLSSARLRLQWVVDHAEVGELVHIARLRLAKIEMAENKFDAALALLSVGDRGSFGGEYDFLKGEIYFEKGQVSEARTAYNSALNSENLGGQLKSVIRLKIDEIGGEAKS